MKNKEDFFYSLSKKINTDKIISKIIKNDDWFDYSNDTNYKIDIFKKIYDDVSVDSDLSLKTQAAKEEQAKAVESFTANLVAAVYLYMKGNPSIKSVSFSMGTNHDNGKTYLTYSVKDFLYTPSNTELMLPYTKMRDAMHKLNGGGESDIGMFLQLIDKNIFSRAFEVDGIGSVNIDAVLNGITDVGAEDLANPIEIKFPHEVKQISLNILGGNLDESISKLPEKVATMARKIIMDKVVDSMTNDVQVSRKTHKI